MAKSVTCECGRYFRTYSGFLTHRRACKIEQERSEVWVAAIEGHRDPHTAVAEWRASRG